MAIATVITCGAGWYWKVRFTEDAQGDGGSGSALTTAESQFLAEPAAATTGPGVLPDPESPVRQPGSGSGFAVVVRDARGKPVAGAECTATALPDVDVSGIPRWGVVEWKSEFWQAKRSISGPDGIAHFEDEPLIQDSKEILIWATAAEFASAWAVIDPSAVGGNRTTEVVLTSASWPRVLVVDAASKPVSGATVFVVGTSSEPSQPPVDRRTRAMQGFRYVGQTGPDGYTQIPAIPGRACTWAEQGVFVSAPLMDLSPLQKQILLTLSPTFQVSGNVSAPDRLLSSRNVQILGYAEADGGLVRVAQIRVGVDGVIPPTLVPLLNAPSYAFVARGGESVPVQSLHPRPEEGQELDIQFLLDTGHHLQVEVVDPDESPVDGAVIRVYWADHLAGSQIGITDGSGKAELAGIGGEVVDIDAEARGFVPESYRAVNLAELGQEGVGLQLQRGGEIDGVVTLEGKPASKFDLVYWPAQKPHRRNTVSTVGGPAGEFHLESVPTGDVLIFASVPGCPRSDVRLVAVDPMSATNVILEIVHGRAGHGIILDSQTGNPVAGARIELWNTYRAAYMNSAGSPVISGPDGGFSLAGVGQGEARFVVSAPGFAQYLGVVQSTGEGPVDLGIVSIHSLRRLKVAIHGVSGGSSGQFAANADGNVEFPTKSFDSAGEVEWEGAGPGLYFVRVFLPDGTQVTREEYFGPGVEPTFGLDLSKSCQVKLQVVDESGQPAVCEPGTSVKLHAGSDPNARWTCVSAVDASGVASFQSCMIGDVYLEVLGSSGDRVAAKRTTLTAGNNLIRVEIGGRQLRVLVVAPDGSPVEGASLDARTEPGEMAWFQLASTDQSGVHHFGGLAMSRLLITAKHDRYGTKCDVPVDLPQWDDRDTLRIVLDPRSSIAVRLLDASDPVPGAHVRILGPKSHHIVSVCSTDVNGVAKCAPVSPGQYLVRVEQPGVWPADRLVDATESDRPIDIPVRKLGNLNLRLNSSSQQSAVGVVVELEDAETHETLSAWVQRGLVALPSGALVTDESGLVRIPGIPRGDYIVRTKTPAGTFVAGRITVRPGPATDVELTLP